MKHFALISGMAVMMVTACSVRDGYVEAPQHENVVFYTCFEQPAGETKVYVDEDLHLRWTADDRVSIFNRSTYNQQYRFDGETGDHAGGFTKAEAAEFVTGREISHVVSVYPYQSSTRISENETLTLVLPAEQHYAGNTFGLGANTMVAVSSDSFLQYKNVGGYLKLSLYGKGVSVSSITLKGNNGEKLAGKASVTMPLDGVPSVTMADDASTEIALVCDTPVALGTTADKSKAFWFVIPPVVFSEGFSITIRCSGGVSVKNTEKTISVERSRLATMSPIEI